MKINFAGDQIYFNTAMDAVLDYEIVRQHPEIIVDFLRRAEQYRPEIPKELLMKEEWLNHKNASVWLSELFRYPEGANAYIEAALSGDRSKGRETAARFEKAYSVMDKVGMDTKTLDLLLVMMGRFGDDAYSVLVDKMLALTSKPTFLELIATVDPERAESVRAFLAWYSKHEPNRARFFEQALNMLGTKRQDFWRLSADRTQYSLAEGEYNAHKARASAARLRFWTRVYQSLIQRQQARDLGCGVRISYVGIKARDPLMSMEVSSIFRIHGQPPDFSQPKETFEPIVAYTSHSVCSSMKVVKGISFAWLNDSSSTPIRAFAPSIPETATFV